MKITDELRQNETPATVGMKGYDNKGFVDDKGANKSQSNGVSHKTPDVIGLPYTISKKDTDVERDGEDAESESDDGIREVWDKPIEFLLSCIAMTVGFGNVWRFPFTAYSNGGGAFLIPYLIVLFLLGRPIHFLEMCLGQFSRYGQVKVWNMAPLFKGVGYGSMVATICVVTYYCSLMAVIVMYFFSSFSSELPWSYCDPQWGGKLCTDNGTLNATENSSNKTISELYYEMKIFPQKTSIDDGLGAPDWKLTLCLAFTWIMVFGCLIKGIKSSGKVAYFTAIFPYLVMLILLIRGVTLEGALDGILYFITPQWDRLLDVKVWYAAAGQCLFSLAAGFGTIIMLSSYNPFRHNAYRDGLIISLMDTFTSLLSGCTIFSVLGFLSHRSGVPIDKVTDGGPGLAFVSYPAAIAEFTFVPQLFAVLFFLMLFTVGIGSVTSQTEGVITIICDQFPDWIRWMVVLVVCGVGFLVGLIYITPGGQFMVDLVDYFGSNFTIYFMVMVEVFAVSWVYGLDRICKDIEFMLGIKPGLYFRTTWGYIAPIGLCVIFVYTMATQEELTSEGHSYPKIAIVCGWLLSAVALMMLPVFGLHGIWSRKAPTFFEKLRLSIKPTRSWGPQKPNLRKEWQEFSNN